MYWFKNSCETSMWGEIFFDCVDKLEWISIEVGEACSSEEHIKAIIPNLILHYMKCRFFMTISQFRKENKSCKASKEARKLSKVSSNWSESSVGKYQSAYFSISV